MCLANSADMAAYVLLNITSGKGAVYLGDGTSSSSITPNNSGIATGCYYVGSTQVINSSGQFVGASINTAGSVACASVSCVGSVACNTLTVGGVSCINSSGVFTGAGVLCYSNGITCTGFNPYISGTQYYGANTSFVIGSTTYNVRGGVITTY